MSSVNPLSGRYELRERTPTNDHILTEVVSGYVVVDGAVPYRIIDAVGKDVAKWDIEAKDAEGTAGTVRGYVATLVEGGNGESYVEASDELGVKWEIVTDDAENDGLNIQLLGEAFLPDGDRNLYFGIKLQAGEATQNDFLVGLCITDTDLLGGMTDGIYFRKVDGSTSVAAVTEKDSSETSTTGVHTFAADTDVILEFRMRKGTDAVEFYVNGALVATHTATIPDNEQLTPSIHFLAGSAAINRMKVAWGRAFQGY
jgi:hypothetical protein